MTSYEISRNPMISSSDISMISSSDIPDTAHWNIRGIVFVNLRQFEVSSRVPKLRLEVKNVIIIIGIQTIVCQLRCIL